jgi:hypothetical protein
LPLLPEERFAYIIAIRATPKELLPEWKEALEEAQEEIDALKRRIAKRQVNPFLKKT